MARLNLTCGCGWTFFLPGTTTGHQVTCPSCGEYVAIPGRKPGQDVPQSAGALAARIQHKQSLAKTAILGAIIAVAAVAAGVTFWMRGKPPVEEEANVTAPPPRPRFAAPAAPAPLPNDAPPIPASPPPLFTGAQIHEFRRNVFANVWLLNMTAILSECARFRGLTNEWAQFQADIAIYDGRIKQNLTELAKVGEKVTVEPYLAQGDQILRFAQKDLTTMKAAEAGQVIAVWASNWTQGVALEKVDLLRAGTAMTLYLQFPETSTELLTLLRHPAIQPGTSAEAAAVEVMAALPVDLLKDVNDRFSALPKGYRSLLLPDDRKRLEDLTASRRGTSEDVDWIKTRILSESIPSFQREAETVRSKILELEPKLKESAATDVIIRKNGTKVEGQIVETTDAFVRIKSRFGSVPIPKDEIAKVEKGKGSAAEFPGKYAEAKDNIEKLGPLLAWCVDKNLKVEKEYVAYSVLTIDASHEKARTAVGWSRPVLGSTSAKTPVAEDATKVEKDVAILAAEVTGRLFTFTDVITEMRRKTEKMTATQLPIVPEKASKGLSFIQNPLTFDASKLPATSLAEIGTWWSGMALEDRRQFAAYYGLWCAVFRARK
jgi:hypothetical protein